MIKLLQRLNYGCLLIGISFLTMAFQKILITPEGIAYETLKSKEGLQSTFKYNSHTKNIATYNDDVSPLSLDCTGNKIAFIKSSKLLNQESKAVDYSYKYELVIIDAKSNSSIVSFDNGYYFAFSPKGNAIAYATNYPGKFQGHNPPVDYQKGVWIYDFNSKSKKQIGTLGLDPIDINWSEHDCNIYIADYDKTMRYNVINGKSEIVPYKGIYFSADGRYYANMATENTISKIYKTADNREMTEWEKMINESAKSTFANLVFVSRKMNSFVFYFGITSNGVNNIIFDTTKGKVIGNFSGLFIGTNADGTIVEIHPFISDSGKIDYNKIEIIDLVDLMSKDKFGK